MLMNKILRYSFMALLAMMVGNVMAQDVTLDFTLETEEGSKQSVWGFPASSKNKQVEEQSFTYNGYTVKVAGSEGNGYYWHDKDHYLLFGKQGAYVQLPAFDFDVARIEIEGTSGASTGVKQNIFVGDEAVSTETTGAKDVTNVFQIAEGYQAAGTIYTIKVTSAHNNQIRTIKIYKKGAEAPIQEPEFSVASGLYLETQSVAMSCEEGARILYTVAVGNDPEYIDDENYTGVFYDGNPLTVSKSTIIKAMAVKNGKTSSIVTAKYTIVNTTGKGTVESPFSVADALQVVAALDKSATTSESYYVKGFVVGTPDIQKKEDGTYYGNANFTIADTKGGADLLTCFRLKGLENENIESDDYVQENDEVLLVGQLQKYVKNDEETPEIKNGHIVSITRPEIVVVPEPVVEGTKIAEMDYTTAAQYPYYRMEPTNPEAGNFDVKDGALVISATAAQANMWEMQPFILDWFNIKAGNNYNIAIYMEATSDVDLWLGFGTWAGSMALYGQKANAARGWNYYTVENATAECATSENNAHILFQCGSFVGTIKIYKVELYEVESTGINNVKANVENAVRYNLAGQKVNNGFKGVVIMNGKKMLQK